MISLYLVNKNNAENNETTKELKHYELEFFEKKNSFSELAHYLNAIKDESLGITNLPYSGYSSINDLVIQQHTDEIKKQLNKIDSQKTNLLPYLNSTARDSFTVRTRQLDSASNEFLY